MNTSDCLWILIRPLGFKPIIYFEKVTKPMHHQDSPASPCQLIIDHAATGTPNSAA
jgi:hypothetical protein